MYDAEKLINAGLASPFTAEKLAGFTDELAEQLRNEAREREAKRNKGFKSFGDAIGVATAELAKVSAALRKTVPAEPIECKAVNQLGAKCMRTDVHEAHTYPPTEPSEIRDTPSGPVVLTGDPDPEAGIPMRVCGIEDRYIHTGAGKPDRCRREPHGRDVSHEGAWSKWPWQDDPPAAARVPRESAMAYLRGEVDELGTEPLFTEGESVTVRIPPGAGTATVHASRMEGDVKVITDATLRSWGPTTEPSLFPGAGIISVTPVAEEAAMQPADPFSEPVKPERTGVWTGGAQPVEPDPRPLWLQPYDTSGYAYGERPITSIRTTQVRMGEQCGMALRLVSRDQVPEVPSWANIGGSALHECAMRYEKAVIEGMTPEILDGATALAWWQHYFAYEISVTETETPFPRSTWRAADKGAEDEDWWNNAGPLMVRDYSAWSAQMHADGWSILTVGNAAGMNLGHTPAMELEMHTPLLNGEITGHLDQAWIRTNWSVVPSPDPVTEIRVIDLKSGSRLPDDDWQLQAYPWELRYRLVQSGLAVDRITWSAAYYDARNGKGTEPITPHLDSAEITYRAGAVLRMHEANLYPANPGTTYKDPCYVCAVRYACPIMALKS